MKTLSGFILTTVLILAHLEPASANLHSLKDLKQNTLAFVHSELQNQLGEDAQQLKVKLGHFSSRLKLTQCGHPVDFSIYSGHIQKSRILINASCANPKPWTLKIRAQIMHYKKVLVAKRTLMRGMPILEEDIGHLSMDVFSNASGYFTDFSEIKGHQAKRTIRIGQVIKPRSVEGQTLVQKGQTVRITASSNALKIQTKGIALSKGTKGQRIRVKNPNTSRIIEAVVIGKDEVRVSI